MQYENERMEYKSQLTDDIYKEVIAFTNTDGGVIYIGIDDQGNVTGIDNVDETYTRLTNGIRDVANCDYLSGTIRAIDAVLIAAGIALGVGLVLKGAALLPGVTI